MLTRRRAFTLVEMLAVIVLILILTTLAVAIIPNLSDKRAAARAADQFQGWLLQARSRAQRDQQPTGLHLIVDPDGLCRRMEFVQQPDALQLRRAGQVIPVTLRPAATNNALPTIQFGQFDSSFDAFRPGDLVQIKESVQDGWYRIDSIPQNPDGTPNYFGPIPVVGGAVIAQAQTSQYSVIRRWRPLAGEPILELPKGTCIDITKNLQPPTPTPDIDSHYGRPVPIISGEVVVLFTPAAGLIDAAGARPAFWIRHEENKGEPTLIYVVASNGSVGAHPVNDELVPGMQNRKVRPFLFVEDGQGSGL